MTRVKSYHGAPGMKEIFAQHNDQDKRMHAIKHDIVSTFMEVTISCGKFGWNSIC